MSDQPYIYKMNLHESRYIKGVSGGVLFNITRVPGGWIYESIESGKTVASVFVPFDNEFQTKEF